MCSAGLKILSPNFRSSIIALLLSSSMVLTLNLNPSHSKKMSHSELQISFGEILKITTSFKTKILNKQNKLVLLLPRIRIKFLISIKSIFQCFSLLLSMNEWLAYYIHPTFNLTDHYDTLILPDSEFSFINSLPLNKLSFTDVVMITHQLPYNFWLTRITMPESHSQATY